MPSKESANLCSSSTVKWNSKFRAVCGSIHVQFGHSGLAGLNLSQRTWDYITVEDFPGCLERTGSVSEMLPWKAQNNEEEQQDTVYLEIDCEARGSLTKDSRYRKYEDHGIRTR